MARHPARIAEHYPDVATARPGLERALARRRRRGYIPVSAGAGVPANADEALCPAGGELARPSAALVTPRACCSALLAYEERYGHGGDQHPQTR
jgi:hypothetical protein